jgi:hypothetical protein
VQIVSTTPHVRVSESSVRHPREIGNDGLSIVWLLWRCVWVSQSRMFPRIPDWHDGCFFKMWNQKLKRVLSFYRGTHGNGIFTVVRGAGLAAESICLVILVFNKDGP